MKKISTIIFIMFFISALSAQDFPKGIWLTGEENTKIETYQKEGVWYGKIVSSDKQSISKSLFSRLLWDKLCSF